MFAVGADSGSGNRALLHSATPAAVGDLIEIQAKTVVGRRSRLSGRRAAGGRYLVVGTIGTRALRQSGIEWDRSSEPARPAFPLASLAVLAQVTSVPFDSIAMEVN